MPLKGRKGFIFTWKIENFLSCFHENSEPLNSPDFIAKTLSGTRWYLLLYPKGKNEEYNQHVTCFLMRKGACYEPDEIEVMYTIKFLSIHGETLNFTTGKYSFKKYSGCGSNKFIEINKLKEKLIHLNTDTLIIRSHLFVNDQEPASHCTAWTKIGVERNSVKWNIANFIPVSWIESKKFLCSETLEIEITLTAPEDSIIITIKKIYQQATCKHHVTIKLSLLDAKGIKRDSQRADYLFLPSDVNDIRVFPSFFTKTLLNNDKDKYLENDMFTLICEFVVSNGDTFNDIVGYHYGNSVTMQGNATKDSAITLQEVLRRMYIEQIHSDVTLRVENQEFKAHKSVLSARSNIFATKFANNMLENQTGIMNITDVEARILNIFLLFLYTGTIKNMDYECASKLIIVADKYEVSTLMEKCSNYLASVLSDINVCDVLIIADMLGDNILKNSSMDYIIEHSDNILSSETWLQFAVDHAKLVTEIFLTLSTNFKNIKRLVST